MPSGYRYAVGFTDLKPISYSELTLLKAKIKIERFNFATLRLCVFALK